MGQFSCLMNDFFGVSVFMVRNGIKSCASASYLMLRSSTQARAFLGDSEARRVSSLCCYVNDL